MRFRYILTGLLLYFQFGLILAQVPFTCKGQFFVSHSDAMGSNTGISQIFIDPVTNQVTFDLIKESDVNYNAMGLRSTDQLIYAIDPQNWHLYIVDAEGNTFLQRTLTEHQSKNAFGGDVTPDGKYLVLFAYGAAGSSNELVLVDLEDPNYSTTTRQVSGNSNLIFDLAFDPLNGDMYGVEFETNRLLRFNYQTGQVTQTYSPSNLIRVIGGVFFDSFGNLYAYGGTQGDFKSAIFKVNKTSGFFQQLGYGPDAVGNDACACPYTVVFSKSVFPDRAYPCDTVEYIFDFANQSAVDRLGVDFQDLLPPGFTFLDVKINELGGQISGQGTEMVIIEDMNVPIGQSTLILRAMVGDIAPGTYANQATIFDLPPGLGSFAISDNPETSPFEDSTFVTILAEPLTPKSTTLHLCKGESVIAEIEDYLVQAIWPDGQSSVSRIITDPGKYLVDVFVGCQRRVDTFYVIEENAEVKFEPDFFEVPLGELLSLNPSYTNTGDELTYDWLDASPFEGKCNNCASYLAQPNEAFPISVAIQNEFGCVDTATVRFKTNRRLFIPNIFTPNGDGRNDLFEIIGGGFIELDLWVFDRWGNEVFKYNGPYHHTLSKWDGTMKDGTDCQNGVYVFNMKLTYIDDFQIEKQGNVTLVR